MMNKYDEIIDAMVRAFVLERFKLSTYYEFSTPEKKEAIINDYSAQRSNREGARAVFKLLQERGLIIDGAI